MKQHAPHTGRNSDPILEVLRKVLPKKGLVLEIASGTGQNGLHFARSMKGLSWQPTDYTATAIQSIDAWREDEGPDNFLAPMHLDVTQSAWPVNHADAMFCANMVHISPWPCTVGLMRGARRVLPSGGLLVLYGPYKVGGEHTSAGNAAFDADLRHRDSSWGIRDVDEVRQEAARGALIYRETVQMPANNLILVFTRR